MLRTALYSLGCSVLILGFLQSEVLGCPVETPPQRWTQTSANGEYELIVEPEFRRGEAETVFESATYRLERVGQRETVWKVESPEFHRQALVANDGDYVVTSGRWSGSDVLTIRNSAGAMIRSLADEDLASIAEQLEGASWSLKKFDASYEQGRSISRQIQLMDGDVIDPPMSPPGFELPVLECPAPAALWVFAIWRKLILQCLAEDRQLVRTYEYADAPFRLIQASSYGPPGRDSQVWRARDSEDEPGPCETIYSNGEVVSERCGPGVASPP